MRLLFVVAEDFYFVGHRLPMARAARDGGFEVHVATRETAHGDLIRAEGFTVHPMPFRRGQLSPLSIVSSAAAIRALASRLSPDLVHNIGVQMCVLSGTALLGRTTPQVHSMTGLGYAFTGETNKARAVRLGISAALRLILNRRNAVTLVQNPDDRATLEAAGLREGRVVLIPGSGVDTDRFQSLPEPEGPITVGFAGRLLTEKGIRALVAAHAILQQRGSDVRLLIAGEPDPANPASVSVAEAQDWGRRPGVTWLGHVADIVSLWRQAHIAALPSHREGLPLSLLEAAAAGRPMIATDAPGCREIVIHDQTGLLVPIENPPALADAIEKLVASRELRQRYGHAARDLVVSKMSAKSIGEATVSLYKSALTSATSR